MDNTEKKGSMIPSDQQGNSENGQSGSYYNQENTNKWMVRFTGLILLVTAIYACFSYGQWHAMNRGLDETKVNRQIEYQAYVGVKAVVTIQRPDNPAWMDVIVVSENTGRTPGLNAVMRCALEHRETLLPEDTAVNKSQIQSGKSVYLPLVDYTTQIGFIGTTLADALATAVPAQAPIKGATKGQQPPKAPRPSMPIPSLNPPPMQTSFSGYYAYGIVDYTDIFGKPHWTKFCYFNVPKTPTWTSCPTFNNMDTPERTSQQ